MPSTADVAHGDPRLFGIFAGDLGQLGAAFFGQRRHGHADV
jgi:hypothetical protein